MTLRRPWPTANVNATWYNLLLTVSQAINKKCVSQAMLNMKVINYSIPHVSWDNRSYIGGGGI